MSGDAARVLIVEDDRFIAQVAVAAVRRAGSVVLGPFPSVAEARDRLEACGADAALLDVNVADGTTFELARRLRNTGIPIVFHTSAGAEKVPADLSDVPIVAKSQGPVAAVARLRHRLQG